MEDLSKYLPLYLGQKILIEESCYNWVHEHSWHKGDKITVTPLLLHTLTNETIAAKVKFKLLSRSISSMTEEEGKALDCMGWETLFQPEAFIKLIEWGFDIFGLKEKGLALYPEDL